MRIRLPVFALAALTASPATPPQHIDPPAAPGASAPALTRVGDSVALTWLEPATRDTKSAPMQGPHALRLSRWEGGKWTPPSTIASGTDFFVNWADVPGVVPEGAGRWLAHWTAQSGDSFVMGLARSEDGGTTWKRLAAAGPRAGPDEQSFVSLLPETGAVRATWLEKRGKRSATMLRTGLIRETLIESRLLDPRVCDCCQIATAATSEGAVVAYRDRDAREIRDIAVVRETPGGWTKPSPVARDGWKISGCPVNGPALAASGRSVAVVWFTAAEGKPRVEAAFSSDAGAHFSSPILVDGAAPLGRVGIVLDENGDAIVVWAATEGGSPTIRLRRVSPAGRLGEPIIVAPTSVARTGGLPSLARAGQSLVIAWIAKAEPPLLAAAILPAASVR